ncbi:MAG TPA: efflux RND transporter permease subunit, partial [Rhodothermales bacterium]|nr:efflux RND transporter permease subunit [Rhodothermales bacterium]
NVADVQINLVGKGDRSEQSHAIALRLRPAIDSIATAYNADVKVAEIPPGPPVHATLVAEVYGPTAEARHAAAADVREIFETTEGVVDVDWSVAEPHSMIQAVVQQAEALRVGANPNDIARTIAASVGGASGGLLHDEGASEPVNIRVQLADHDRGSIEDVKALPVSTLAGGRTLVSLAGLREAEASSPIFHKNLRPVVYITADVAQELESPAYAMIAMGYRLSEINDGMEVHWAGSPSLTEETFMVWDGEWRITFEVFRDLGIAFAAVLILIYVLVVAWFQSFTTPLVIMAPIPLTLVGILPAHAISGAFFTATSMIGMIALAGIIVRNSILLVDFIQLELERGQPLRDAVIASGLIRARPIILTALAVVIGGMVMVTDPIFEGLGVALMSGAVVATLLTLVAIPLLYYEMHK